MASRVATTNVRRPAPTAEDTPSRETRQTHTQHRGSLTFAPLVADDVQPNHFAVDFGVGRYYDPQSGQFPSVDPIVRSTGQPFQYVSDDAPNATDPTGDAEWSCIVLVTDPAFRAGPKRYGNVSIRGTQTCIGAGWGPEDIRTAIINPDTDKVLAGWNVARPTYENFVIETSEVVCKGTRRTRFLGVANGLAAGGTRNQYVESLNAHTVACTP